MCPLGMATNTQVGTLLKDMFKCTDFLSGAPESDVLFFMFAFSPHQNTSHKVGPIHWFLL